MIDTTNWKGIFPDMPMAEYHTRALGVASSSGIKLVRRSLAHYAHWARTTFDRRTAAMEFGSMYHAYVLEPESFEKHYIVAPAKAPKRPAASSYKAKNNSFAVMEAMEFWADFDERHAGKEVVTRDNWQKVQDMRAALENEEMVGELPAQILTEGKREASFRWIDETTGLPSRARFDYWHKPMGYGLDLKSCIDGTDEGFTRAIVRNEYHISQAHYLSGAHALNEPLKHYLFLSQETTPPYVAAVTQIGSSFEELGFNQWRRGMDKLGNAMKTGLFPGYTTGIRTLEAPAYAFYNDEEESR